MAKIKRRKFLITAGIGALVAGFGGYVYFESFEKTIRKIIVKDTRELNVSEAEIDKFMAATRKENFWKKTYAFGHQQVIKWHYYIDNALFSLPYERNYQFYRGRIVAMFLLSTNFFQDKMDEKIPVKFTTVYDPYQSPCSNPFSNIYYPEVNA